MTLLRTSYFQDLEREASRLDQGMAALLEFVTKRETDMADVHDIVNRSIAHANNLASQAELLDR